jgi:hypothetical protein
VAGAAQVWRGDDRGAAVQGPVGGWGGAGGGWREGGGLMAGWRGDSIGTREVGSVHSMPMWLHVLLF